MIMLSKLVESNNSERIDGDSWMDPKNTIHSVLGHGHRRWALEYINRNDIITDDKTPVYDIMYKLGFIRIVNRLPFKNYINIEYNPITGIKPKQLRELKDIAIEQKMTLFDDVKKYSLVKDGNDITESLKLKNILENLRT